MNIDDPRIIAGLAAQAQARRAILAGGARHLGWKAGVGTQAAMQRIGTSAPLVGFLTDATLLADGESIAVTDWENPTLEAEVAIKLGSDLPPGASQAEVLGAIAAVGPAIELVDLGAPDDVEAVLTGNIFHRAWVLGVLTPWPARHPLDDLRLAVRITGGPSVDGIDAATILGPLVDVVRALADQLPAAGDGIRAGDVVITGAATPATALSGGETVAVELNGQGAVTVHVS